MRLVGSQRAGRRPRPGGAGALIDRTNPNALGVHFYDEPGLTWFNDPISKKGTNASVPAQLRSFKDAFGTEVPHYAGFDRGNAEAVAIWRQFTRFKATLMDAAWQDAAFGVSYVKPDFMNVTQSQYGWSALSDGYYYQLTRNLSVTSGHGGYHDWGPGYWHPSFTLEIARARDFSKPTWYLPAWYHNTTSDEFRLEQYLSFQTGIQGMMTPPDLDVMRNPGGRDGIAESNRLMGRLGTVFTTMPVTRGPVAILYSLSQLTADYIKDQDKYYYAHTTRHGETIHIPYIASKLLQQNAQFVVDEDVADGTLEANYKTVILHGIDVLDAPVAAALERFATRGGKVIMSGDSTVRIKGATVLAVKAGYPPENVAKAAAMKPQFEAMEAKVKAMPQDDAEKVKAAKKDLAAFKQAMDANIYGLRASIQGAQLWAAELKPILAQAGIQPVFACSEPGIAGTVQRQGDVEYLFAVNATHDFAAASTQLAIKGVTASIGLANDGRPVYDAIRGGAVAELKADGKTLSGSFGFGPGEMRVFARTSKPIGKVQVLKPVISADTTLDKAPVRLAVKAQVLDNAGDVLVGAIPLRIRVIDALGAVRYDLYRATRDGVLDLPLTLAVNDPAGGWTIEVTELLGRTVGSIPFAYQPMTSAGAMAGTLPRAAVFGDDRANLKRFFRVNKSITLVPGTSDFAAAAAKRFAENVKPWGVKCAIVAAADLNKPEPDPMDAWLIGQHQQGQLNKRPSTWCGPGGFDVPGPCVLFGSPEDNPLIKGIAAQKVLPYAPAAGVFPGTGRGMLAWQLDSIRQGYESVTAIAFDAAGMAEAVGSLYQAVAAQDPINFLDQPLAADIAPAGKAVVLAAPKVAWRVNLPDRADLLVAEGTAVTVATHDGTVTSIDAAGKATAKPTAADKLPAKPDGKLPDALKSALLPTALFKTAATGGDRTAIAYWGGMLQVVDATGTVKIQQLMDQDITGLAWLGGTLVVGLADGQVLGLTLP